MKNFQKIAFLLLMTAFGFSSTTFAQAEKEIIIVKKSIDANGNETEEKIVLKGEEAEKYIKEQGIKLTEKTTTKNGEKEMTIEVRVEGDDYEEMTITVNDENGNHELKEDDQVRIINGDEIPDDVRKILLEKGIDIDDLIKEGKTDVNHEEQHYKVIEIDDDGNKKVIEWNGAGDMPSEMSELMKKLGDDGQTVKKKIMIIDDEDVDIDLNGDKKIIKIRKDKNGEQSEEVYELEGEDEIPSEILNLLKEHGIDPDNLPSEGKVKIQIEVEEDGEDLHKHQGDYEKVFIKEMTPNKVQLGVMVDDDQGLRVVDFIENGAAETAGVLIDDLIVKLDKNVVTDLASLMNALSDKEVGDVVKLKVVRAGKTKKVNVTLKAAEITSTIVEETSSAVISKTDENYRTEHKMLKIKGGNINECAPDESVTQREKLTDEEIEIVEERIIEETGVDQVQVITGTNTLQIGDLDLFPNPTDGSIRVRFQIDNQLETKVQIIDIAGRALYENKISDFSGIFDEEIDLAGKGMGTLVLVITQGKKAFTEKIILN